MKTKLFFVAAMLIASVSFASVDPAGTCTLDASGTKECFGLVDGNGTITGYSCDTATSSPNNNRCK